MIVIMLPDMAAKEGIVVTRADAAKMAAHAQVIFRLMFLKMAVFHTDGGAVFRAKYSVKYLPEIIAGMAVIPKSTA